MLPLLQAHEIHKSILEFFRLCFTKPHHHQRLHCWELLMGQSFSVRNCREQQTPALLVPLRRRKGGRQTGMLSVPAEACQGQVLPLSHHGACPRQCQWFNGEYTQGWCKPRFFSHCISIFSDLLVPGYQELWYIYRRVGKSKRSVKPIV